MRSATCGRRPAPAQAGTDHQTEPMTDAFAADPAHQPFALGEGRARALLIHGFMGTPKEMRPLGEALAEAGVAARGILLPGFGPDGARLPSVRTADWLRAANNAWEEVAAGAERTTLVGFSMGGAVALQLAARRAPDRLVLIAPHWRFADRRALALPVAKHVVRAIRPFQDADFSNPGIRQAFAEMAPGADLDDPAVQVRLRPETALPTASLDELRRVSAGGGAAAGRIDAPTLILQGRNDATVLPHDTRRLAARIRGPISLHELSGGHVLVSPQGRSWPTVRDLVVRFATAGDPS